MHLCSSDVCNGGEHIVCQMIVNRSMRKTRQPTGQVEKARNSAMIKHIPLLSTTLQGRSVNSQWNLRGSPQVSLIEAPHWGCFCAFYFMHLFYNKPQAEPLSSAEIKVGLLL